MNVDMIYLNHSHFKCCYCKLEGSKTEKRSTTTKVKFQFVFSSKTPVLRGKLLKRASNKKNSWTNMWLQSFWMVFNCLATTEDIKKHLHISTGKKFSIALPLKTMNKIHSPLRSTATMSLQHVFLKIYSKLYTFSFYAPLLSPLLLPPHC